MKQIIYLLLLISFYSNAQRLDTQDLQRLLKDKSADKQTEYLLAKKFMQVNSMKDSTLIFKFDKSNSRIPGLDKEIVKVLGDTVTYIIYNPKTYLKFKDKLEYASKGKTTIDNEGKITYQLIKIFIVFKENETLSSENIRREYIFKCFNRK